MDSKKLEDGPWTIYAGFPSLLGFGVEVWSYSNFLASTAIVAEPIALLVTWGSCIRLVRRTISRVFGPVMSGY